MENAELFEKLIFEETENGINLIDFKDEYKNEAVELVIPDSWNVVSISKKGFYGKDPFNRCKKLKKVKLPATLTDINYAFCECENLEEVVFPDNLKKLGNVNFCDCPKLKSVKLPAFLERVGFTNFSTFGGGEETTTAIYNDENNWVDDVFYIGSYLMKCKSKNSMLKVKDGTTLIADNACSENRYVKEVYFPNSLQYIGSEAFYGCENLQKPNIPESVKFIGEKAFYINEDQNLVKGCHVTDGYFSKENKFELKKELGYFSESAHQSAKQMLDGYLLKIEKEEIRSYDNSDDDRVEPSSSQNESVSYYAIDVENNTESLLRVDGEIKGVIFRVRDNNKEEYLHAFMFDGSVQQSMRLGYSASHSSCFTIVKKVTLVKKGENGAPNSANFVKFNQSEMYPSI